MKHNLPMVFLFGIIAIIGIVVTMAGIRQKRNGDIMIGVLITIGSLLVYFIDFFRTAT
jgi:hypothetical protein